MEVIFVVSTAVQSSSSVICLQFDNHSIPAVTVKRGNIEQVINFKVILKILGDVL